MLALAVRVAHAEHLAARVALGDPQGERAPAAAHVEHAHAVLELAAPAGEVEHGGLGGVEVTALFGPQPAAVLAVLAKHVAVEGRRHLVVLFVRGLGLDGDRSAAALGDPVHQVLLDADRVVDVLLGEALAQEPADAEADDAVGQQAAGDEAVGEAHEAPALGRRGNHGTKVLVSVM